MPTEADYYQVLGVPRDADLEEVKLAYRKAALSYHPDNYEGDPAEAEGKFRALIEAYKAIAASLDPSAWSVPNLENPTFTPQDFAREGDRVFWRSPRAAGEALVPAWPGRRAYPTRNETLTFACLWAGAMGVGLVVGCGVALYRSPPAGLAGLDTPGLVVSVLWAEAAYLGLAVASAFLIVLTRRAVRLTLELLRGRWRFLPGPGRALPKGPKDRQLPGPAG
jgi:hypothetical protein